MDLKEMTTHDPFSDTTLRWALPASGKFTGARSCYCCGQPFSSPFSLWTGPAQDRRETRFCVCLDCREKAFSEEGLSRFCESLLKEGHGKG